MESDVSPGVLHIDQRVSSCISVEGLYVRVVRGERANLEEEAYVSYMIGLSYREEGGLLSKCLLVYLNWIWAGMVLYEWVMPAGVRVSAVVPLIAGRKCRIWFLDYGYW